MNDNSKQTKLSIKRLKTRYNMSEHTTAPISLTRFSVISGSRLTLRSKMQLWSCWSIRCKLLYDRRTVQPRLALDELTRISYHGSSSSSSSKLLFSLNVTCLQHMLITSEMMTSYSCFYSCSLLDNMASTHCFTWSLMLINNAFSCDISTSKLSILLTLCLLKQRTTNSCSSCHCNLSDLIHIEPSVLLYTNSGFKVL